ncbi:MAG: ferrous iron transport protein B [Saccharofermentanales bacterium]
MSLTIALAGNPNSGKTTLFNRLTGTRQTTGNWPGVTVEKKSGYVLNSQGSMLAVDLPGIYSLSPYSLEEVITRNYIVQNKPDIVVNVVDATNLERNLYLTLQLKKLGCPMIVVLNMIDEVRKHGDKLDADALQRRLDLPVIQVSAKLGEGIHQLVEVIRTTAATCAADPAGAGAGSLKNADSADLTAAFDGETDEETFALYQEAAEITNAVLVHNHAPDALSRSDKIDRILTNRFLAIPIFLLTMFLVFQATFHEQLGGRLTTLLENLFDGPVFNGVSAFLTWTQAPAWIHSLLLDGVLAGVGGMLTFLPQIALLFIFLTILEDTGYMARAAFVVDRIFQKLGLSGRSFIPMMMGFGCTVPAIMAARTLENERDRRLTIMVTPFMSCGARMPIYALFASVYFASNKGLVTFSMYMIGVLIAIVAAFVLSRTVLKGQEAAFVIELPPYRLPDARSLFLRVYDRLLDFVTRAGTVILTMTIVIWFMQNFSFTLQKVTNADASMLGVIGGLIAPLFRPLGFGTYQAASALLTGLIAKESVVSTLNVLYTSAEFAAAFTPLTAYAFMVFTLLYTPCVAAIAALHREMNSTAWTLGAIAFQTGTAYTGALIVAQSGKLATALPYLIVALLGWLMVSVFFRRKGKAVSSCCATGNETADLASSTTLVTSAEKLPGKSSIAKMEKTAAQSSSCASGCAGCNGCPSWFKPKAGDC